MQIPKSELRKLAKYGFELVKSKAPGDSIRGHHALYFVFGPTKTTYYMLVKERHSADDVLNSETSLLNSIND